MSPMRKILNGLALLGAILLPASGCGPSGRLVPGENLLFLEGATLIDGAGGPPRPNAVVAIGGTKIVAVGNRGELRVEQPAQRRDLTGLYIIPGLINMSARLGSGDAARATARRMLQEGITTARAVAGSADEIVSLRKQIAAGETPGPQIFATGV